MPTIQGFGFPCLLFRIFGGLLVHVLSFFLPECKCVLEVNKNGVPFI